MTGPKTAVGQEFKPSSGALTGPGAVQIDAEVKSDMADDGYADYLLYFDARPDLSPAYKMDWTERGRFVVESLQKTAAESQAAAIAVLEASGTQYRSFWIDNVIAVRRSNQKTLHSVMYLPGVTRIVASRELGIIESQVSRVDEPPILKAPMPSGDNEAEPNISHVGAPEVWSQGVDGSGIVVASIDSGVRYTHSVLVNQYRGNNGDDTFSHEYSWYDPYEHLTSPVDDNGHGSASMGIIVGADATGLNQTGMAPGASWITCRGCANGMCTDSALLACAQWMVAPTDLNGENPDPDRRPHLVNNGWGDCGQSYDDWYQAAVDSWHAAGIYPIFSAGNAANCRYSQPPECGTIVNPGRYGNVTAVGSTTQASGEYHPNSNWGPTDNLDTVNPQGDPSIKPQVVAPGLDVRSSIATDDNAFGTRQGTSVSVAHVSGLIALVWQAAPCLIGNYAQTENLMEHTATPIPYATACGSEGTDNVPNNATGWGEINAARFVQAAKTVCGPSGTLQGHVTDQDGSPIKGVKVEVGGRSGKTDATGLYTIIAVPEGNHDAVFRHYRYDSVSQPTTIVNGETTVLDASLTIRPTTHMTGTVRDGSGHGWPLYAKLQFMVPTGERDKVFTDPMTGEYQIEVVEHSEYQVTVTAYLQGYDTKVVQLTAQDTTGANPVQDFTLQTSSCEAPGYDPILTIIYSEDFEASDGGFTTGETTSFEWGEPTSGPGVAHSGTNVWATNLAGLYNPNENGYITSPLIDLSSLSDGPFSLSWWQFLQTEKNWDYAGVEVSNDGGSSFTTVLDMSGKYSMNWTKQVIELDSSYAVENFVIRFKLDSDNGVQFEGFYIDDIMVYRQQPGCNKVSGGLVFGQVRDRNTGTGLVEAVVSGAHDDVTTFENPADPNLPKGVYFAFAPAEQTSLTATYPGYSSDTATVNVLADEVVRQDFELGAGHLVVDVKELYQRLYAGFMEDTFTVRLTNDGTADVTYTIHEAYGHSLVPTAKPTFKLAGVSQPHVFEPKLLSATAKQAPIIRAPSEDIPNEEANILSQFSTGHVKSWSLAYDTTQDTVWVGETLSSPGDSEQFLEIFLLNGTSLGTMNSYFASDQSFIADGTYDPLRGTLWFMVVADNSCIHEVDVDTRTTTGRKICPDWTRSQTGLAYDPITDTFFASSWGDNSVTQFNRDGEILQHVQLELPISGLAFNYTTKHLYAMVRRDASQPSLQILDPNDNFSILKSFSFPARTYGFQAGLGIDCKGHAWVLDQVQNQVLEVDVGEQMTCISGLDWVDVTPETGVLQPGKSVDLSVRLFADAVEFGHYEGRLRITEDTPYAQPNVNLTMDYVDQFKINITHEGAGTTDPTGTVDVWGLDDLTITFHPNDGYHVHEVYLDNVPQGQFLTDLTLQAIDGNHDVHVQFGYACTVDADCVNQENDCLGVCGEGLCQFEQVKNEGDACGDRSETACSGPDTCDGEGLCLPNHVVDGTTCSDANGCTVGDSCVAGTCVAGTVADCSGENDQCNTGKCSSTGDDTYKCVKDPTPHEGASCDADSDGCTVGDACVAGTCVAGSAADCSDKDDQCNRGVCKSTGVDSFMCEQDSSSLEGSTCDDGDPCTVAHCKSGVCSFGEAVEGCCKVHEDCDTPLELCDAENNTCKAVQCLPCEDDADCGVDGNQCLQLDSGKYCVVACDPQDADKCPDNSDCSEVADDVFVCIPADRNCKCDDCVTPPDVSEDVLPDGYAPDVDDDTGKKSSGGCSTGANHGPAAMLGLLLVLAAALRVRRRDPA